MTTDLSTVETARILLRMRALRWDYFQGDLFDEYAWNILLVLFIAGEGGRETPETVAVQEASVPPAVGVRWVAHLEKSGLIERGGTPAIIRLTDHSRAEMAEYLQEAARMLKD